MDFYLVIMFGAQLMVATSGSSGSIDMKQFGPMNEAQCQAAANGLNSSSPMFQAGCKHGLGGSVYVTPVR
jgi:hypothetical protein